MDAPSTDTVRGGLVSLLATVAGRDDDSWIDAVMSLVDDLCHLDASQSFNDGDAGDDDVEAFDVLHGAADARRAELHSAAPETVAEFLTDEMGADAALVELRRRLTGG